MRIYRYKSPYHLSYTSKIGLKIVSNKFKNPPSHAQERCQELGRLCVGVIREVTFEEATRVNMTTYSCRKGPLEKNTESCSWLKTSPGIKLLYNLFVIFTNYRNPLFRQGSNWTYCKWNDLFAKISEPDLSTGTYEWNMPVQCSVCIPERPYQMEQ